MRSGQSATLMSQNWLFCGSGRYWVLGTEKAWESVPHARMCLRLSACYRVTCSLMSLSRTAMGSSQSNPSQIVSST